MKPVNRAEIADYIDTGEGLALMGQGFTALDEHTGAVVETRVVMTSRQLAAYLTGYQTTFSFDTDMMKDGAAVLYLFDLARRRAIGSEAETTLVRVELFRDKAEAGYPARKIPVVAAVTDVTGLSGEIVRVAGSLYQTADAEEGWFDPETGVFTGE